MAKKASTQAPQQQIQQQLDSLESNGVLYFAEDVSFATVKPYIRYILEENIRKRFDKIHMIISSYGGDTAAAFALTDVMRGSKIPVKTTGLGMIASSGLIIFMAGQKGERAITPNTMILSHQFSGGTYGKEHELLASAKRFDLASEKILKHYKDNSALTEQQVKDILLPPTDVWLSAVEAKKYGIVDKVLDMGKLK